MALDSSVIPLFVGFDQREAVAYHVFCQSVLDYSSAPVAFIPLNKSMLHNFNGQRDGTNAFTVSRYLVPMLMGYEGWAILCDGDMVVTQDLKELWDFRIENADTAVCVVQHSYQTKHPRKYLGSTLENFNVDYPRKNWSSVVLWNCGHPANRWLDSISVSESSPSRLHRFEWLTDGQIGALPSDWNRLIGEEAPSSAHLSHYTLGIPGLRRYADCFGSWRWHTSFMRSLHCGGENAVRMVERSTEIVGEL